MSRHEFLEQVEGRRTPEQIEQSLEWDRRYHQRIMETKERVQTELQPWIDAYYRGLNLPFPKGELVTFNRIKDVVLDVYGRVRNVVLANVYDDLLVIFPSSYAIDSNDSLFWVRANRYLADNGKKHVVYNLNELVQAVAWKKR